ncbi:hypothetical protein LguiA_002036 [Lonicera macranthoides]
MTSSATIKSSLCLFLFISNQVRYILQLKILGLHCWENSLQRSIDLLEHPIVRGPRVPRLFLTMTYYCTIVRHVGLGSLPKCAMPKDLGMVYMITY